MDQKHLLLNVITPHCHLEKDTLVEEISAPAYRGEIGVLPGHAPLFTTLSEGILKYKLSSSSHQRRVAVSWGYLEVSPKGVTILAETAEKEEDIDKERAQKALHDNQSRLENVHQMKAEEILTAQRKVKRAQARLQASSKINH